MLSLKGLMRFGTERAPRPAGYFFAFLACRFSFSVFCAGFFSMLFLVFLSLVAMVSLLPVQVNCQPQPSMSITL
jgi:hypothetical protein